MLMVDCHLVISVAPSPQGELFATGSGDMRARIWKYVPPRAMIHNQDISLICDLPQIFPISWMNRLFQIHWHGAGKRVAVVRAMHDIVHSAKIWCFISSITMSQCFDVVDLAILPAPSLLRIIHVS